MKTTIEKRRIVCDMCGAFADINCLINGFPDGATSRWMNFPVGWFVSPSFDYLCSTCAPRAYVKLQDLQNEKNESLGTIEVLRVLESKIDALTATIERGFMVEVPDAELPEEPPSQGVTAAGSPWCSRCPGATCEGLAILGECEIRKGVPLPAPFDGLFKIVEGGDDEKEKP